MKRLVIKLSKQSFRDIKITGIALYISVLAVVVKTNLLGDWTMIPGIISVFLLFYFLFLRGKL